MGGSVRMEQMNFLFYFVTKTEAFELRMYILFGRAAPWDRTSLIYLIPSDGLSILRL